MNQEIQEHDVVALIEDLPEARLTAGEIGTVVHVYKNGVAFEVEFRDARHTSAGGDSGVVTVERAQLLKLRNAPEFNLVS